MLAEVTFNLPCPSCLLPRGRRGWETLRLKEHEAERLGEWEKQIKTLKKQRRQQKKRVEKPKSRPPPDVPLDSGQSHCLPSRPCERSVLSPQPAKLSPKPLQRTNYLLVSEMGPRGGRQIACLVHNKLGRHGEQQGGARVVPGRGS